jgi:hypothetical protein
LKIFENSRKKAGTATFGFMTSLLVTLAGHVTGHVTPSSHDTSDHAQWYILYYNCKKKAPEKSWHTSVTAVTSGLMMSLPVTHAQWPDPLKYDLDRADILLEMIINSTNINKTNNTSRPNSLNTKTPRHMTLDDGRGFFLIVINYEVVT